MRYYFLLLSLFIIQSTFAQRQDIHIKDGSLLKGILLEKDTVISKKDTTILQNIQIQGGTILQYPLTEIEKIEAAEDQDSSFWDEKVVISSDWTPKRFQLNIQTGLNTSVNIPNATVPYIFLPDFSVGIWLSPKMNLSIGNLIDMSFYASNFMWQDIRTPFIPLYTKFEYYLLTKEWTPVIGARLGHAWLGGHLNALHIDIEQERGSTAFFSAVDLALKFPSKSRAHLKLGGSINYYRTNHRIYISPLSYEYDYNEKENNTITRLKNVSFLRFFLNLTF